MTAVSHATGGSTSNGTKQLGGCCPTPNIPVPVGGIEGTTVRDAEVLGSPLLLSYVMGEPCVG